MSSAFPCTIRAACTIRAPNATPMAWWPRQTPRMGTLPAKRVTASTLIPASSGLPGPGEMTMPDGFFASSSATVILSLRNTSTGSSVSSHRYWYRLCVNES